MDLVEGSGLERGRIVMEEGGDESWREWLQDILRTHRIRSGDVGPRATGPSRAESGRASSGLTWFWPARKCTTGLTAVRARPGPMRGADHLPALSCARGLWGSTLTCFPTTFVTVHLSLFGCCPFSGTSKWHNTSGLSS